MKICFLFLNFYRTFTQKCYIIFQIYPQKSYYNYMHMCLEQKITQKILFQRSPCGTSFSDLRYTYSVERSAIGTPFGDLRFLFDVYRVYPELWGKLRSTFSIRNKKNRSRRLLFRDWSQLRIPWRLPPCRDAAPSFQYECETSRNVLSP